MRFELGSSCRIGRAATTLMIAATIVLATPVAAGAAPSQGAPVSACPAAGANSQLLDPRLMKTTNTPAEQVEKVFIAWNTDGAPDPNGLTGVEIIDGQTAVDSAVRKDSTFDPVSEVIVVEPKARRTEPTVDGDPIFARITPEEARALLDSLRQSNSLALFRTDTQVIVCTRGAAVPISGAAATTTPQAESQALDVSITVDGISVDATNPLIPQAALTEVTSPPGVSGASGSSTQVKADALVAVSVNLPVGRLQLQFAAIPLDSVPVASSEPSPTPSAQSGPSGARVSGASGASGAVGNVATVTTSKRGDSESGGGGGIVAGLLGLLLGAAIGAGAMYLVLRNRTQQNGGAQGAPNAGGAPAVAAGAMYLGGPSNEPQGPAPVVPSNSVYDPIVAGPAWQHRSNRDPGTGRPTNMAAEAPGVYSISGGHPTGLMASVWCEKALSKGEDAVPLMLLGQNSNAFVVAVADGMGGSGSTVVTQLVTGEPVTAAAVAAAAAMRAVATTATHAPSDNPLYPDMLQQAITAELAALTQRYGKPTVGGSLVRSFPTTLAAAAVAPSDGSNIVDVVWAGDSRVYWLSAGDGLHPLTADDVEPRQDDLALLRSDPKMSNFISADRPFRLNHVRLMLPTPGILITATDGVFGYLPSPIHVELAFLQALAVDDGSTWDARQKQLTRVLRAVAKDDLSMTISAVGFRDVESIARAYGGRLDALTRFVNEAHIADGSDAQRIDMAWSQYRQAYESLMPQ